MIRATTEVVWQHWQGRVFEVERNWWRRWLVDRYPWRLGRRGRSRWRDKPEDVPHATHSESNRPLQVRTTNSYVHIHTNESIIKMRKCCIRVSWNWPDTYHTNKTLWESNGGPWWTINPIGQSIIDDFNQPTIRSNEINQSSLK